MKNYRTNKKSMPFHLRSEDTTIIMNVDKHDEAISKKISFVSILILSIAIALIAGCSNHGSARIDQDIKTIKPIYLVTKEGNQCEFLNKQIADILEYTKKFDGSQLAAQYHVKARMQFYTIEARAKQASCHYISAPDSTRLHNVASL